jgi:SSS family solute:Na+ symporter
MVLGFKAIGVENFFTHNADRLHMILPTNHPVLPWTGLLAGMWIPIFYYCGLNQFIVQRTLAAKDLRQGQRGVIFAAALWLLVPFFIVLPGIMALQLYPGQMEKPDQAFPLLIRNLIPAGLRGFMFAAIAGAVISSLASMLNSAATIFTMDLYKRHFRADASQLTLVATGRVATVIFVVMACLVAPFLGHPRFGGVFNFIQEFQGYISPGILAAFVFGFVVPRAPGAAGVVALLASAPIYGILQLRLSSVPYLNRMALTFVLLIALMEVITVAAPLREPKKLADTRELGPTFTMGSVIPGAAVIAAVVGFYLIFW